VRVAFIGKGGAGKSTIGSTFARLLARRGNSVVAVDSDPMPGMCFGLGLGVNERPIPDDAVVERPEGEPGARYRLRPGLDSVTAIKQFAMTGADNVRLLSFGKTRGEWGDLARGQHAWSQILDELSSNEFDLVGDLPGGTRQPMTGWGKYADALLVVVEPTAKSIATAIRLSTLRDSKWNYREVVAVVNRVSEPGDAAMVELRTGLTVVGAIPLDPAVGAADRLGLAPLDVAPHSPFVESVDALVSACILRFSSDQFNFSGSIIPKESFA
jgi:CO dehydrogenase maturation factor